MFFSNVASGPGRSTGHSACEIRGAGMVNMFGSCSGMAIGMHVTASTAQSVFSNTFHAIDAEVDGKVLVIDKSGGAAPAKNTWVGGQWDYAACAIDASAGADNLIVNANLGGVKDFCPGHAVGVNVIGPTSLPSTLNTLRDLGLSATNGVAVWPSFGANSGFNFFNGSAYFSNQAAGASNAYAVTATGSQRFYVGARERPVDQRRERLDAASRPVDPDADRVVACVRRLQRRRDRHDQERRRRAGLPSGRVCDGSGRMDRLVRLQRRDLRLGL